MALTNSVIRRAASRAMPLAARATENQSCPTLFATAAPTTGVASQSQKILSRSIRYFTKVKPEDNDHTFLKIIDKEIKCQVDSQGHNHEIGDVPENFPFNIQDEPKERFVTLYREYEGERISVKVNMGLDENENNDEGESKLSMVVTVSKFPLPHLEFNVSAYKDKISIDDVSINDPKSYGNKDDDINKQDFVNLNQNLQKAFHKYLDIRGINASTLSFLHEYKINKNCRVCVGWLENVKMILEK